jgi:hypothetical protein
MAARRHGNANSRLVARKAWLVSWDAMGECELKGKVAAVLNSRLSPERVAAVVEIPYASLTYSNLEKALSAARPKVAACRATTEAADRIHCGPNP